MDNGHYHPTEVVQRQDSRAAGVLPRNRPARHPPDSLGQRPCGAAGRRDEGNLQGNRALRRAGWARQHRAGLLRRLHQPHFRVDGRLPQRAEGTLSALLTPNDALRALQDEQRFTELMVRQEALKTMPFGDVWDEYCRSCNVPVGTDWFETVPESEHDVLYRGACDFAESLCNDKNQAAWEYPRRRGRGGDRKAPLASPPQRRFPCKNQNQETVLYQDRRINNHEHSRFGHHQRLHPHVHRRLESGLARAQRRQPHLPHEGRGSRAVPPLLPRNPRRMGEHGRSGGQPRRANTSSPPARASTSATSNSDPEHNMGIVEINDKGDSWRIVWGLGRRRAARRASSPAIS